MTLSDDPRIFCYRAPQFNIWRAFHDVSFEVSSQGTVPFVHAAAEDSLHGIIDKHVKAKRAKQARAEGTVLPEVGVESIAMKRAVRRKDMLISPVELLTECPRPWAPHSTVCTKDSSPFGRTCVAVSLPKSRLGKAGSSAFNVTVTTKWELYRFVMFAVGAALLYLSHTLAKSKIFCYSSGISVSILLGAALLLVLILRRVKAPGAKSFWFGLVAVGGYGMALISATGELLRVVAIEYWVLSPRPVLQARAGPVVRLSAASRCALVGGCAHAP